jgi:hypothetical protein
MTALRLATANGLALAEPHRAPDHPDARLLALRQKMRDACDVLIDDPNTEARRRVTQIAGEIAIVPARTLQGIWIKGKALRWSYFGDQYFEPMDFDTANGRLFVSLLHDLDKFGE